jgi:hypothetical protein
LCLEPHGCVLVKLAAGREKDYAFATALADAGLIDVQVRPLTGESCNASGSGSPVATRAGADEFTLYPKSTPVRHRRPRIYDSNKILSE